MRLDRFDYTVWTVCLLLIVAIAAIVWFNRENPVVDRDLAIIYRSIEDDNLYRAALNGAEAVKLTDIGNRLFDFSPSPNGNWIAYSVLNDQKGIDIWTMDGDGESKKRLIDCGLDRCSAPSWSPDGAQLAYSRQEAGLGPGEPLSPSRIWLADTLSGETARLFQNAEKIGFGPSWSPDGRKLAFSDGVNSRMVILNLETGDEFYIPNQTGRVGSWSPDSRQMVYSDLLVTETGVTEVVNRVDFETEDIINLFGHRPNEKTYSNPVWSPTGEWIAVNTRPSRTEVNYELTLMASDASYGFLLTDTQEYPYFNYSFDPTGGYFIYQRTQLGISNAIPEVLVVDLQTRDALGEISGASFPSWLP